MFGWFRIPRKVVDGRAQPELMQKAELNELEPGVVVVFRDGTATTGQSMADGRVITYEIPQRE